MVMANREIGLIRFQGEIFLDPSILVVTWRRAMHRRKTVLHLSQRVLKSRGKNTSLIIPIGRANVTIVHHSECTLVGQNSYEPMAYLIIIDSSLMFCDDA